MLSVKDIEQVLEDFESASQDSKGIVPPPKPYEALLKAAERAQDILYDEVRLKRAAVECWPWRDQRMRTRMKVALMDECQAAIDLVCEWSD